MSNTTYSRRHMALNIIGALKNYGKKSMAGLIIDDNGKEMTDREVRLYLHNAQVKGWKLIPFSSECEGFDHFGGGCPGHPITKEEYEKRNK